MKKSSSIFWGIVLVAAAVLIILDGIGSGLAFLEEVPVTKIVLGLACLYWLGTEIWKKRIAHIFFPLAFLFILFEKNIAKLFHIADGNLASDWAVLLGALLLTIGVGMIFKEKDASSENGRRGPGIAGNSTRYIDCTNFTYERIENRMGNCDVYFDHTEGYAGGGTLYVENHMGNTTVHVPADWYVSVTVENSMGSIEMPSPGNATGPGLTVSGKNHMGNVEIILV